MKTITDYALRIRPLTGLFYECGDTGIIIEDGRRCFLSLIDVLGHGGEARDVAVEAECYLKAHYADNLLSIMNGLHSHLYGSRGAVVSVCRLDRDTGKLEHAGIGNITVRIIGYKSARLISRDGIVGYGTIRPHAYETKLVPGDILIMHSDGITGYFNELEYRSLFLGNAETISRELMEKFGSENDDASCLVLKYTK